jgi:putative addiction module killer protein
MIAIRQTEEYFSWFARLRDVEAKSRILIRIRRLSLGNPGDAKPVGYGVSELRIKYGPGYRIYFKRSRGEEVVLLCAGDKSTQQADIKRAHALAQRLEDGDGA